MDNLNPIALAYMYMDDGVLENIKKQSRYMPYFCSESFTREDCERICERLHFEWSLSAWTKRERVKDGVIYARICISKASVKRFFEMVAPYLLPCFDYKIPPEYRGIPKKDIEFVRYAAVPCADFHVRKVKRLKAGTPFAESLKFKYDLTVADNHNIVVSSSGKTQQGVVSGLCACQCAKNAFRSELVKVNQYRKRYHVTSDNLEKFYGVEDHEVDKHDVAKEVPQQT